MTRSRLTQTLRIALAGVLTSVAATSPARADADSAEAPNPSLAELASAYQARPVAERIVVTHRSAGVERSESLTVFTRPPHDARIEFGPYIVWITDRFVRVIQRQDMKGFFETPVIGADPIKTLESIFPALPAPQLGLLFARPGEPIELTPYCRGLVWEPLPAGANGAPSERRWIGRGQRVEAQLVTFDGKLSRLDIRADGEQEITIAVTPITGVSIDTMMESELGQRKQVRAVADLFPRPGDSGVGSPLPPLTLTSSDIEEGPATPTGPCAILFFDHIDEGVAIARDALRIVHEKRPTVEVWPTLVTDIFESRLSFRIDEAKQQFEPDSFYYTVSPTSTVERFTEDSRSALVVVDDQSIVRAVLPMPTASTGDRKAQVDRLVERMLEALRPQPQTP